MNQFSTRVGIDLARRAKHKAVIVNGDSQNALANGTFSFAHDAEGMIGLRDHILKKTGKDSLEGVIVNMEPTSNVFEALAGFLSAQGAEVFFTRPDVVSALRKVHSRFAKTDRIDAHTLAQVPVTFPERLIRTVEPEPRIRRLRQIATQRMRLVEDTTRWKNRLFSKLELIWNPLMSRLGAEQRYSALARKFFKRFANPSQVTRLGKERFAQWWEQNAHGGTSPKLFDTFWQGSEKSAALWEMLARINVCSIDWDCLKELVEQDLRLIANLEKETKRLDKRIEQARQQAPECDLVEQLPGVGKVVSVTLVTELLPSTRFSSAKKCGAYTGFTSRQKSSGGNEIEGLKITKSGNRRLKRDLALAADTAMRNDAQLAAFAIRLLRAGKHYNKARVAVGRKLAVRAYSLLKRYEAGQQGVEYIWRDPSGVEITRKQAKALASELWTIYDAEKKEKGSRPGAAKPWQPKDSTKRSLGPLPETDNG